MSQELKQGLLVVGTDDGLVRISRDNGNTWEKYENFPGVPKKAYVTDVITSKHDVNTMYVSFNYHKYGDFKPYLIVTKDGGRTWKSISSNIPENNFVWTVVEDHINPNVLFIGTEFGMYFSMDAGASWRKFNKVPTIPIRDLEIHEGEDDLVAASFGRGFYIVDDYSPIREYSRQIDGLPAHLFTVKSTYQYIVAAPEKTATGHNFFTSPNPPYGVKLSYYLGNSILSKFEERQNEELNKFNKGETIDYPTAKKLEDEAKEKTPKIYLTISDSQGKVVRRISSNKNKGYHEKYWDLRTFSQRNIDDENNYSGPLVPPGKYSVHIEKFENDKLEKLTDSFSFDIIQIGSKSSQEDREKLYGFQLNFDELVSLVNELVDEIDQAIEKIDGEINKSLNSSSNSNLESLNKKKGDIMDLKMILTGTRSLNYADVFSGSPPSVQRRLGNMSWELYNTTSKPTKTHEMTYKISKEKYDEVLRSFREIMD